MISEGGCYVEYSRTRERIIPGALRDYPRSPRLTSAAPDWVERRRPLRSPARTGRATSHHLPPSSAPPGKV
jgi:hypothetical protein